MPFDSMSSSSSAPVMIPGMMGVYNQLLGLNQQNYSNILNAYGGAMGNLNSQLPSIYQGFGDLSNQVQQTLGMGHPLGNGNWGVATPAAQQIARQSAMTQGKTDQGLINSGLANTTIRGNLQNQNDLMTNQAYGALGAQLAQTSAGYLSQLGLAGLNARQQGLGMQTQLAQAQGSTLGGYHFSNTAGNLVGQAGTSRQSSGGTGGGGSGGGTMSGGDFMGGLPGTTTAWGNDGRANSYGSTTGYTGGGFYSGAGGLNPGGGGGSFGDPLYDYDKGGNYGGAFLGTDGFSGSEGDFGGGGEF